MPSSRPEQPDLPATATVATRSAGILVAVLVLAEIVSAFESSMVFVAIPRFMEVFDASAADVGWTLTAFLLVTAASAVLAGRLGDIYGRKKVLVLVLALSAVGSVVSVLGDSLGMVIAGRALQGVAGGIMPLCFGIARASLPRERVPFAVAMIAGSALIAGAAGSVISGVLIDVADWHWIFVVAAVFATVAALVVGRIIPRDSAPAARPRVDWLGAILLPIGVGAALLAVTEGNKRGWLSSPIVILFVLSAVLLASWYGWQRKSASPLFDVRLLARRDLGSAYVITILLAVGVMGLTPVLTPIILQTPVAAPVGLGMSASAAGYVFAGSAVVGFLAAPFSGKVAARFGAARAVMIGTVLLVLGMSLFALGRGSVAGVIVSSVILAVGTGFAYTALPNLVVESVSAERTGEATGFATLLRGTFNAVSAAVVGALLASGIVSGTTYSTSGAYNLVFGLGIACCVAALVVTATLPARRLTDETASGESASSRDLVDKLDGSNTVKHITRSL
ncbi:MFS transporter [Rhodococcus sovatensis]|uniref:MFS transporter n=1 Tax=Rhodococcus sovatensis TaxID=1805840 RepID=A0ABZ2PI89_9NOCA